VGKWLLLFTSLVLPDYRPDRRLHPEEFLRQIYLFRTNKAAVGPFPKMSEAMDGRGQAHRDVLVAFFGKGPTAA
jgi:hypothetical protein